MRLGVACIFLLLAGCTSAPSEDGVEGHLDSFLLQVENDAGQIARFTLSMDGREVCEAELRDMARTPVEDCVPSYARGGTIGTHTFSMDVEYEDGRHLTDDFETEYQGMTFVIKHFSVELQEHCTNDPRAQPQYDCDNWRP